MSSRRSPGRAPWVERLRLWTWMPLLLTVAVRAGWLAAYPVDPIAPIDAEGFHLLAVNLLDGNGFAIGWEPPFCPTAVRTPLYPLFLAGTYTLLGRLPARVVPFHILLEVLTTALVMALARELWMTTARRPAETFGVFLPRRHPLDRKTPKIFRRRHAAMLVAGLLYALNGTTQRFTGYLFSETFLLPLLAMALLLTLRALRLAPVHAGLAGLSWGLVLLVKPNEQYLGLAAGLLLTWHAWRAGRRRRSVPRPALAEVQPALAVMVAFWVALGLTLMPWLIRNRLILGRWALSTAFEENVARVSAVAAEAALRGVVAEPWTTTWEAIYDELEARAVPELAVGAWPDDLSCAQQAAWKGRIATLARRVVLQHSGIYLRVHLGGVARGWLDPGHRLWYRILTGRDWTTTGVVPSIGQRMAWSLTRGAVGDALEAFWSQRIARIPLAAGLVWWGLIALRGVIGFLVLRGLWCLRRQPAVALVLAGALAYHVLLPGPIAHDRFYVPIVPVTVALLAAGSALVANR